MENGSVSFWRKGTAVHNIRAALPKVLVRDDSLMNWRQCSVHAEKIDFDFSLLGSDVSGDDAARMLTSWRVSPTSAREALEEAVLFGVLECDATITLLSHAELVNFAASELDVKEFTVLVGVDEKDIQALLRDDAMRG